MERYKDKISLLEKITHVFVTDTPRMIQKMQTASHSADPKTISAIAHKIKGVVMYFYAKTLYQKILKIEEECRLNNEDAMNCAIDHFEVEFNRTKVQLLDLIDELKKPKLVK